VYILENATPTGDIWGENMINAKEHGKKRKEKHEKSKINAKGAKIKAKWVVEE
jgi:hypothetical protein